MSLRIARPTRREVVASCGAVHFSMSPSAGRMNACLVRTVPIVVRAPRAAVLAVLVLVAGETVRIVPAGDPVVMTIDAPVGTSIPTGHVLPVTTKIADPVVLSAIHLLPPLDVPTNPGIVVRPVIPTGTMTALAGRLPMATAVPPAMTIAAHHVPTAEMTVVRRVMVVPARHVRSPVANAVGHEMAALAHLDGSLMIAAERHGVTMTAAHHVPTAVMTAALRVMVGLVHHVVNLMIAVVARVVQDHRGRANHVASTTALHVIAGVKIAPRSHVHPATNRVRGFSVMTLAPALTVTTRVPVLTATTAHAEVVPRTVTAGNARSRQKSKNVSMPSGLPSPVVGVA